MSIYPRDGKICKWCGHVIRYWAAKQMYICDPKCGKAEDAVRLLSDSD